MAKLHIVESTPDQIAEALIAGGPVRPELGRLYERVLADHLAELMAKHSEPVTNVVPLRGR